MSRLQSALVLLLAGTRLIAGQAFASLDACSQNCVNSVVQKGGTFGCPTDAVSCLCMNPDFQYGIIDCATQACGAADASSVMAYASTLCATATLATQVVSTTPPAASVVPPVTTSTPLAPTTSAAESSPVLSSAAVVQNTAFVSSSAASSPAPSSTAASSTASLSSSTLAAADSTPTATSPPPGPTTSSAAAVSSLATGTPLTVDAKVGIAVGAGAGALALVAVAIYMCLRRRNNRSSSLSSAEQPRSRSMQISEPMVGSARVFALDRTASVSQKSSPTSARARYEHGMSELELKSRRYEDMVPRTKPRLMV